MNRNLCDVLYSPNDALSVSPPLAINIKENLENAHSTQIIEKCTDISEMYQSSPVCLIISAQKLYQSIIELSLQFSELPFSEKCDVNFGQNNIYFYQRIP
jgi:hypothetical protein